MLARSGKYGRVKAGTCPVLMCTHNGLSSGCGGTPGHREEGRSGQSGKGPEKASGLVSGHQTETMKPLAGFAAALNCLCLRRSAGRTRYPEP